jgi:hypothetical protein
MIYNRCIHIFASMILLAFAPALQAQQNAPHIGYVYPAGGRQGDSFQITVGGQYLDDAAKVFISGGGVQAKVVACVKPLAPKQINELREKMQKLQKSPKNPETVKELAEIRTKLAVARKLTNPGIADKAVLQVTIDADAELDSRELRLETANGLSNPLVFQIGQLPEVRKKESQKDGEPQIAPGRKANDAPRSRKAEEEMNVTLPALINGQILPGGEDRYQFQARKGQRIVVAVSARELIPYLADAVPGWFQAAVAIYDSDGNELAYDDHFRFHPDPVLFCKIPKDGAYVLKIRDAIYRGREDFVYRITAGELPFVTSIFPLGGPVGAKTAVELKGWNLPQNKLTVDTESLARKSAPASKEEASGIFPLIVPKGKPLSNRLSFAVDALPECLEQEPNNQTDRAQSVALPIIVNGRIDAPGDRDIFRFESRKGEKIVVEVDARKLGSSLDSVLELTDADGRRLAFNDDRADKGEGLSTHHADSFLTAELPAKGDYYLSVGDSQHKGGAEYGYRLRISEPRPDFALLLAPSSINVRAGGSVPITVYALRKDGFNGEIALDLKDAPKGFALSDARIAAGQDRAQVTLTAPQAPTEKPLFEDRKTEAEKPVAEIPELPEKALISQTSIFLTADNISLEGKAMIEGREIVHRAAPADDRMQAFIYHHLVPADSLLVAVTRRVPPRLQLKYLGQPPVKLSAGQTASLQFAGPRGPFFSQMQFELKDALEGITLEKISPSLEGVTLQIRADADNVKTGSKGNLIVDVFAERIVNPEKGKPQNNKRRIPLGALPAIPFEIVDPAR